MTSQSAISMSDIFDISGDLYDLSGSFYTNLATINTSSITTSSLEVSGVVIAGDVLPQLLIKPARTNNTDALLTIRGARPTSINSSRNARLRFENHDKNNATNNLLGGINGSVTDHSDNTGELRFNTSADGTTETLCVTMDSTNKTTIHGNLQANGDVGVGTSNPSKKLEVVGDISCTNFFGNWTGNSITDTYISSASYWNSRLNNIDASVNTLESAGVEGSQGTTGTTGTQGTDGTTGTQGTDGTTGTQGTDGTTGTQGTDGTTGTQGADGTTGTQGTDGTTGTQGTDGTTGTQGTDGTTGTQGSDGTTGTQGTDGTTGTQGSDGTTGTQGSDGTTGTQGTDGTTGTQGTDGTTGTQGTDGTTGTQGTDGTTGTQGSDGTTGTQGTDGTTGTQGTDGTTGTQGTQGIIGITGTGTQGTQGIAGSSGGGGGGTSGIIANDTAPQLSVQAITSANIAQVNIIGKVDSGTGDRSKLVFKNRDGDGDGVLGEICGVITNNSDNNGGLIFRTASGHDGGTISDCLTMTTTNNVGIGTITPSEKLDVAGNVNITGRLNITTSGTNALSSGYLNLSSGNQDMNDASIIYSWSGTGDGTYLNTNSNNGAAFVANIGGYYNISVLLHSTDGTAELRSMVYGFINIINASDTFLKAMYLGSCYYRDDHSAIDDTIIAGAALVYLESGHKFQIKTIRVYSQDANDDNPANQTASRLFCEYVGL